MILRVGGFAAILVLAPVTASAGDGTFGIPPSGILLPPPPAPAKIAPAKVTTKTAALIPAERAAPEKVIPPRRVQQTYQPAPADGAGRSRAVPPSEAPVHSPVITPPKSKQFKAPQASVDPDYVDSVAQGEPRSLSAPPPAPVVAQGAAPEPKRGLFNMLRNRNAGAQTAQVQQVQVQQVQDAAGSRANRSRFCRADADRTGLCHAVELGGIRGLCRIHHSAGADRIDRRSRAGAAAHRIAFLSRQHEARRARQQRHAVQRAARHFHLAAGMPVLTLICPFARCERLTRPDIRALRASRPGMTAVTS